MSTIQIKCVDQTLTLTNTPIIASGGTAEDYVQFDFCPLWDGYIKTAVFWRTPTEARTVILDSEDKALIPPEILTTEGVIYIGAFGTNGTTRRTSEVVRYKVVQGAVSEDTEVPDPSADVWTQILALCADILDKVDNAQAELDSAAETLAAATEALNNAENKLAGTKITTEQYTDGSVTRAKLANDAKYSQRNMISSANYSIVASDGGKTIISNNTIASSDIVVTLSQSVSAVMPTDAEIALLWLYGKSFTLAADGVRFAIVGSSTYSIPRIKITDKFGMISIKKVAPDSNNGDLWLVQGLAEVVS